MTVVAETAEWLCTRCGTSNRKLVPDGTERSVDRCQHCRARHVIRPGPRPVRWESELDD
jgi:DNA-directed RNA polymerase subunit RPC12/RpoP